MTKAASQNLFACEQAQDSNPCSHVIRVAFETAADTEFDYAVPDDIWPVQIGQRVEVPLGKKNKPQTGFCIAIETRQRWEQNEALKRNARKFKLKRVRKVIDKEPLVDDELMELAGWISSYYVCPLGQVLAAIVPSAVKRSAGVKTKKFVYLCGEAETLIEKLRGKKQKQIVDFLKTTSATSSNAAIEMNALLDGVGCGREPLKRLTENAIVKTVSRSVLKSLPVIPKGLSKKPAENIQLNHDQQKALVSISKKNASEKFGVTLLFGVTDSGKTEIYIRAIQEALKKGRSAIVMLPEIALTAQTVERFSRRFKDIAVMHSGLTAAQRNVQWQKIKSGRAKVVIGARSAVFAPVKYLGLIVVDEEHESSYKQDTTPRYHGRDVAIKRAHLSDAQCILGSATPSLESLANCRNKKHFSLVTLPRRVMNLPMPQMKLVDMRQSKVGKSQIELISESLHQQLKQTLERKEQAILLLNRRGYSNFVFCPSCRHTLQCRNCDVTLTFHKSRFPRKDRLNSITGSHINYGYAVCHYCLAQTLVPEKCPLCGKGLAMIGLGSQRLEEELVNKFPQAITARIDSDSMAGKDYYKVLDAFSRGQIDILAGTQILAKGLHFPNVTLVGIISADTCLYLPDFRTNERTFQLISQVAGRAGRSVKKGTVIVQSFLPDQQSIRFAVNGDYEGFIQEELKHRKDCNLPPFWRLAAIVMRDMNYEKLEAACEQMRQRIDRIVKREDLRLNIRGPMPAAINRIQRFHRMQIIIQSPQIAYIQKLFECLRTEKPVRPAVRTVVDIDPVNLL